MHPSTSTHEVYMLHVIQYDYIQNKIITYTNTLTCTHIPAHTNTRHIQTSSHAHIYLHLNYTCYTVCLYTIQHSHAYKHPHTHPYTSTLEQPHIQTSSHAHIYLHLNNTCYTVWLYTIQDNHAYKYPHMHPYTSTHEHPTHTNSGLQKKLWHIRNEKTCTLRKHGLYHTHIYVSIKKCTQNSTGMKCCVLTCHWL